jgi:hypothetical protein
MERFIMGDRNMADKTVTSLELTEEQRSKIAKDLGLGNKLDKVPTQITIAGLKSSDLAGAHGVGGKGGVVAVIM